MTSTDRWAGGADYEAYVGRWSRPVGAAFVDWLAIGPGARWLDVGCGTGALTDTILARAAPGAVLGIDPSASFVEHARDHVVDPRVTFALGSADTIPLGDGSVDIAVAGLVLNFVPDVAAALAELRRVVVDHGIVGVYVWDYAGRMEMIRRFWDAAIALDPEAAPEDEGSRFPLSARQPLVSAFAVAGFADIDVRAIDVPSNFRDFDELWRPFLSGVGPAPGYAMRLGEERRSALRERLRSTLPVGPDGSIRLNAGAWAVRARNSRTIRSS